jgi:hypothetical protein
MKFKMAATAGLSLTLDPMGKMFQNASSLKPLRWWPSWISDRHKKHKFVEDLPMIIPGQFGFREEAFLNIFPIGSNVKQVLP